MYKSLLIKKIMYVVLMFCTMRTTAMDGVSSEIELDVTPVWIQTNDKAVTMLKSWKVQEMGLLQKQNNNSRYNPCHATMISQVELLLLDTVFNHIQEGTLGNYYNKTLFPEYDQSMTYKNVGQGLLR